MIMQERHEINIISLIEQVLGYKFNLQSKSKFLFDLPAISPSKIFNEINYYLENPQQIDQNLINQLVHEQLAKFDIERENPKYIYCDDWDSFQANLENTLQNVIDRKSKDYWSNNVMPTKLNLALLQDNCWRLTAAEHGIGTLSCLYKYYIDMCQYAGDTCFIYSKFHKFVSVDGYVTQLDLPQRRKAMREKVERNALFADEGGKLAHGISVIDATNTSNILYYKSAQQLFYLHYAQNIIVSELGLENYGQLPYEKRRLLWHLIQEHYPDNGSDDLHNIFREFVDFTNERPGEYFNYFSADLPLANKVPQHVFHDIIKVVGIKSGNLVLLPRSLIDNLIIRRYLTFAWIRKYPLNYIENGSIMQVRKTGHIEQVRIVPNGIPYAPSHGMSLCGNGLLEGLENYSSVEYEWNTPIDPHAEIDNKARDIEKLFREMKVLSAAPKHVLLSGECYLNMYQNNIAYSIIQSTQHTHILRGTLEDFKIYNLPATHIIHNDKLDLDFEFVPVGEQQDAIYIRIYFENIDNEELIQYLIALNQAIYLHFGGAEKFDAHLQIFVSEKQKYVFIYEPHIRLIHLDNDQFLNPENNYISARRPQYLTPEGENIDLFNNELSDGLEYIRNLFDATCKRGVYQFCSDFISR
jgi:hypothetical protein